MVDPGSRKRRSCTLPATPAPLFELSATGFVILRRLILLFAGVAPVAAFLIGAQHPLAAVGIVFLSHMALLYPTLRATSQIFGPVVTSFETKAREVWLTIDDGPDPVDTPRILELLRERAATATFFVKGEAVERHPELARAIIDGGHSIGNHSHRHPSATFWCLGPKRIADEIDRCNAAVEAATGRKPEWFRAPVGMKNPFVHPALARRKMTLVAWNARGFDGVSKDTEAIVERIVADVQPGAIILAHEGGRGATATARASDCIKLLLRRLEERGYRPVAPDPTLFRCGSEKVRK